MDAVDVVEGRMCPLFVPDVDTDQIMPKQFLKRIGRTGYGELVFHGWRQRPGSVLEHPRYGTAPVLLGGPNFGCGSSREHAVWGLQQFGFAAVVAPSFGDIFRSNCHKNGVLAVELPAAVVRHLVALSERDAEQEIRIDVRHRTVVAEGVAAPFALDDAVRTSLLLGLDEIDLTLGAEPEIAAYESRRQRWLPVSAEDTGR